MVWFGAFITLKHHKSIFMKHLFISFFFISLGCAKKDDCFIIREKASQNGYYYFLDRIDNLNHRDDITGQIRVTASTYNEYMIGDEFCVD